MRGGAARAERHHAAALGSVNQRRGRGVGRARRQARRCARRGWTPPLPFPIRVPLPYPPYRSPYASPYRTPPLPFPIRVPLPYPPYPSPYASPYRTPPYRSPYASPYRAVRPCPRGASVARPAGARARAPPAFFVLLEHTDSPTPPPPFPSRRVPHPCPYCTLPLFCRTDAECGDHARRRARCRNMTRGAAGAQAVLLRADGAMEPTALSLAEHRAIQKFADTCTPPPSTVAPTRRPTVLTLFALERVRLQALALLNMATTQGPAPPRAAVPRAPQGFRGKTLRVVTCPGGSWSRDRGGHGHVTGGGGSQDNPWRPQWIRGQKQNGRPRVVCPRAPRGPTARGCRRGDGERTGDAQGGHELRGSPPVPRKQGSRARAARRE